MEGVSSCFFFTTWVFCQGDPALTVRQGLQSLKFISLMNYCFTRFPFPCITVLAGLQIPKKMDQPIHFSCNLKDKEKERFCCLSSGELVLSASFLVFHCIKKEIQCSIGLNNAV